jgi:hypothetical protein
MSDKILTAEDFAELITEGLYKPDEPLLISHEALRERAEELTRDARRNDHDIETLAMLSNDLLGYREGRRDELLMRVRDIRRVRDRLSGELALERQACEVAEQRAKEADDRANEYVEQLMAERKAWATERDALRAELETATQKARVYDLVCEHVGTNGKEGLLLKFSELRAERDELSAQVERFRGYAESLAARVAKLERHEQEEPQTSRAPQAAMDQTQVAQTRCSEPAPSDKPKKAGQPRRGEVAAKQSSPATEPEHMESCRDPGCAGCEPEPCERCGGRGCLANYDDCPECSGREPKPCATCFGECFCPKISTFADCAGSPGGSCPACPDCAGKDGGR